MARRSKLATTLVLLLTIVACAWNTACALACSPAPHMAKHEPAMTMQGNHDCCPHAQTSAQTSVQSGPRAEAQTVSPRPFTCLNPSMEQPALQSSEGKEQSLPGLTFSATPPPGALIVGLIMVAPASSIHGWPPGAQPRLASIGFEPHLTHLQV